MSNKIALLKRGRPVNPKVETQELSVYEIEKLRIYCLLPGDSVKFRDQIRDAGKFKNVFYAVIIIYGTYERQKTVTRKGTHRKDYSFNEAFPTKCLPSSVSRQA